MIFLSSAKVVVRRCDVFGGDPKLDDEFYLIIVVLEIGIIEMLPHVATLGNRF